MFFTEMCPWGGTTKYASFELLLGMPWGEERGRPWYGTFAKPKGHFTEGMFDKCCNILAFACQNGQTRNLLAQDVGYESRTIISRMMLSFRLRGPTAILFISRDASSMLTGVVVASLE